MNWPIVPKPDRAEMLVRMNSLPALAVIFGGPDHQLVLTLAEAVIGANDIADLCASEEMKRLSATRQNRILESVSTILRIIEVSD